MYIHYTGYDKNRTKYKTDISKYDHICLNQPLQANIDIELLVSRYSVLIAVCSGNIRVAIAQTVPQLRVSRYMHS